MTHAAPARWLLTVPAGLDLEQLAPALVALGAELGSAEPVPLPGDEQVVGAIGPADLPARVLAAGLPVTRVSPDSDQTPYGPA